MRVLIGPMARQAGRQGIQRLLEWAPEGMLNTNVVHCVENWPALLEAIRIGVEDTTDKYDVLVAEFRLPGSPEFAEIHALDPTISVIDIDLDQGTSNTPMFDVSSAKLRRLAEWLTKEAGLTSTPAAMAALTRDDADEDEPESGAETGPVTELEAPPKKPELEGPPETREIEAPEDRPALETPFRPRLVATGNPAPADPETQIDDLVLWLELRLASMLSPSSTEVLSLDIPGWGINANRARLLLGDDLAELTQPDLQRRWEEVNARLHGYVEAARHHPGNGSLGWLCHAFGLDEIERQVLWIVAAPDIAGNLAQAIGFLNDDLSARRPTLSLLAQMIEGAGRPWKLQQRLAGSDRLGRFRLVSTVRPDPLTPDSMAPLRAPDDLVALLRGCPPDAVEGATLYDPADFAEEFDPQLALVQWAASREAAERPVVHFHAPPSEAAWLARQLASAGNRVLVGNLAPATGLDPEAALDRLLAFGRAARVADAVLVASGLDEHPEATREGLIRNLVGDLAPHLRLLVIQGTHIAPTALRGAAGGITEVSRPRPTREERASIWDRAAADRGLVLSDRDARELGATFAFDRGQAEATVALAVGSDAIDPPNASEAALREAARLVSRASAPPSVTRIETRQGWDDIILPASVTAELKSIVVQIKHGTTVWEEWGFGSRIPYGQAMIALLAGPSGTGKTMAAQIIAGELGAALFQVDLAKTVSKYIGETEKALDRIFEAAEAASAVLLFDEADALFGKRSEIHDAHDRYANIEVNFLLQRIEEHLAPVLLTTNRKANIDAAFLRRLNKVVDFPMPDEEQRALIWQGMLPPEAEVADDVDLAAFRQLPLSGGSIANAVLAAAFMGAEDGGVIRMRHLVAAARGELAKGGMQSAGRSLTHLIEGAGSGAKS